MNEMLKRAISGFIYVGLIVTSILVHPLAFAFVFGILTYCALHEFYKITYRPSDIEVPISLASMGGLLLFVSTFLFKSGFSSPLIFSYYAIFVIWMFIRELFLKKSNPIHNWAYFILGQVMVALPMSLLIFILFVDGYQPMLLLSIFILTWLNDTGAYLIGVKFGRHRFFEHISPKKTWEGFFGGIFFSLTGGFILSLFIAELSIFQWLALCFITVLAATLGDLTESLLKRTLNIKDSGNLLPGHGGLLDRLDSMLLVSPFVLIFFLYIFV
ncbi:MAG: phosphatidate cytidylyltransferase [Paludibacteraceae bacterium]|jgi:phosphatidate cytidylyltransferase|nr:phosphatidate cytidylyltransferase [Paludibacteraceae bacterium]MBP8966639.1 phosphatidate cytidylyltransferase [Paludibacteraceae bacterium]HOF98184.1 phosphatidate cytidylyltransferase [Paludibacteraceae bacterium]HOJ66126.1 phosphatidate cytidylyltransferase [Paludibacteraceae bacterium]HON02158.1 phosphatidate cytidylyltransferase [Paludibacteraceae bacterium]